MRRDKSNQQSFEKESLLGLPQYFWRGQRTPRPFSCKFEMRFPFPFRRLNWIWAEGFFAFALGFSLSKPSQNGMTTTEKKVKIHVRCKGNYFHGFQGSFNLKIDNSGTILYVLYCHFFLQELLSSLILSDVSQIMSGGWTLSWFLHNHGD